MSDGIPESEFYMWRTIFAIVHADDIVTDEEVRYMAEIMEDVPFGAEQRDVLNEDVRRPQDINDMFSRITEKKDQARFFKYARQVVHVDGDYGEDEQNIMLDLIKRHVKDVELSDLVGQTDLELADTDYPERLPHTAKPAAGFKSVMNEIKARFFS